MSAQRKRADTRALILAYEDTHRRLRDELEEQRISRLQSQGHIPRHFHQSQQFKQTGDIHGAN